MAGWETPFLPPPLETFWTNPQFRLTLLEPDEEEDEDEEGPWGGWGASGAWGPARGGRTLKCTVLLSLTQRNRRRLRAKGLTYLTVGFHVFQVRSSVELRLEGTRMIEGRGQGAGEAWRGGAKKKRGGVEGGAKGEEGSGRGVGLRGIGEEWRSGAEKGRRGRGVGGE